jgi:soluble lytic murein transglycosylase
MKRALFSIAILLALPAHAADPAGTLADWKFLRDPQTPAISFAQGLRFLNRHGDWPDTKLIRLRTEEAALREQPERGLLHSFCATYPPISGRGMVACAHGGYGSASERDAAIRQAWLQGDYSPFEEKQILGQHGALFNRDDHEKRTARLLYERKIPSARRMLPMLSASQQQLAKARIALQTQAGDANAQLARVPAALKNDAGLTLDRIRWRNRKGMNTEMRALFLDAPFSPPYADEWWPLRAIAVREALQQGQADTALRIIARHGNLKPEFLAEALWLKGWITLQRKRDAGSAYKDFFKLYHSVSTPVSLARGAYWAAKAAKRNGNADIAHDWLEKAAEHPTVFYGQLAHAELHPGQPLDLPRSPTLSSSEKQAFAREELPRVVRLLNDMGDQQMVDRFLIHMGEQAKTPGQFALLADLATTINAAHGGVVVGKLALRKGIVLTTAGWPTTATPANLAIEPALTHAITRQESEFNPKARSSANAQGLMQLLPGTARDMARKLSLPFGPNDIWTPQTNMLLGSAYLGRVINGWDGSYILGIASYNAGPRNVRNWVEDYGQPPASTDGAIDWIENIPFGETRNYVQRVLENVQVYRQLLKQSGGVKLADDLKRGR